MLRNPTSAVVSTSIYLGVYHLMFLAGYDDIVTLMFTCSPILVVWMVITVVKYGKYTGKDLGENEEWGYEDKSREQF